MKKNLDSRSSVQPSKIQHARLTIGALIPQLNPGDTEMGNDPMWQGIMSAAQEQNVNLITFVGNELDDPDGFAAQANMAYDLVSATSVDGLVIAAGVISIDVGSEKMQEACDRYRPLPMVSIGLTLAGMPCVLADNDAGMRASLKHLIETHGYRRIAFICGPEDHQEVQARYNIYLEVLKQYGLPVESNLCVFGEFGKEAGMAAIHLLLDERGVEFDAVITDDDSAALGAMTALKAREMHVPDNVAVVGYDDDMAEPKIATPPLTTVQYPYYDLGRQAVEILVSQLENKEVPEQVSVPAKLVVRQSCGCPSQAVMLAGMEVVPVKQIADESFEVVVAKRRGEILQKMEMAIAAITGEAEFGKAERLLDAFVTELKDRVKNIFLPVLEKALRQEVRVAGDLNEWHGVLSTMNYCLLPLLDDKEMSLKADTLFQQGRVLIGEMAQRDQAYQTLRLDRQNQLLRGIEASLISTFDIANLAEILAEQLIELDTPGCYLALYENPQDPTGWAKLIMAYNGQGRADLPDEGYSFPTLQLIPDELWPQTKRFSMVVKPLYFRENHLGFILFETGTMTGDMYEVLRGQISSALTGALLMQQEEKRSRQLQTVAEVSTEASASLLDTTMLLQKVVDLTKESFGLYHAHIYLINQDENTLTLAAGAGEVGRKMVADGWHISVDAEQSLVAQSAQARKGCMVNNVRENPDWLPNPLLPDTCAELAVPLIAGEHLVGVLDVQSDEINTFTEDDIQIQSTLATQVAVTLENAKLFERLDQANAEIKVLNERLQEENVRMIAELNVAQQLQEMLLPNPEELQQIEGMDIAGHMKPADEVGGDYYDVLQHNGRVKIGIGDVTGHGLESGVVMLMLQTAVRTLLTSDITDPIQFMDILNRTLHKNIERMNVDKSLSLALVDYAVDPSGQAGEIRLSGQHEQLIVVRQGGQIELEDTSDLGFPIGLIPDIGEFVSELSINLEPGDGIVLYSDGITEAENEAREFYGLERLCEVIRQHWSQSADAIKQAVVDNVDAYIGEQMVYDDITLLVVKQK